MSSRGQAVEQPPLILRGETTLQNTLTVVAADPSAVALFCDIDGTISPIAPTPCEAIVPGEFRAVLRRLVQRLGLVAFVTGRDLEDGRRMVRLPKAAYVGTHGLELLDAAGARSVDPEAERWLPAIRDVVKQARAAHLEPLGVLVEDKRMIVALHYRQAPDQERARTAILERVIEPARARGLWTTAGYLALEVRPPVTVTKGTAARRLLAGGRYRTAIFLGDDLTDCNGFDAVHEWAAESALSLDRHARPSAHPEPVQTTASAAAESATQAAGRPSERPAHALARTALAVAALTAETWPEVKEAADVWVSATPGMLEVLRRLLQATGTSGSNSR
jgi:trehalose 6-phosphate phosphatase